MQQVTLFFENFLFIANEASPWLLLGLLIAGLMKSWVPSKILSKHLGSGKMAIVKAALIGAPLPLCSCGVIPVATELRRSGASAPATSSFLVATPETGVDSVTVSYALLGPVLAIYRPISAILSAIITGLLVATSKDTVISTEKTSNPSCCATTKAKEEEIKKPVSSCCSSSKKTAPNAISKTFDGVRYAATQLIDDLKIWLLVGLLFATVVKTFIPDTFLLQYGSGLGTMLLMIVISIPMYICATASTPVAAGFLMAGISPGTALVFMMAGPATNISTLGVIKNEMGSSVLVKYLLGISLSSLSFGLLLDWLLQHLDINVVEQMSHNHELLPYWLGISSTIIFALLSIKPLRKLII